MVRINLLKAKLLERDLKVEDLAPVLQKSVATVYRKLDDDGKNITVKEARQIGDFLQLTADEMGAIFFAPYVA